MFNPPVKQQRDKKGHPLFDALGQPLMQTKDNLGYDENGKKLHALKEKPPKTVSVSIRPWNVDRRRHDRQGSA